MKTTSILMGGAGLALLWAGSNWITTADTELMANQGLGVCGAGLVLVVIGGCMLARAMAGARR